MGLLCWDLFEKPCQSGEWEVNICILYLEVSLKSKTFQKIHFLVILVGKTIFNGFSRFFHYGAKNFFFPLFLFSVIFFLGYKKENSWKTGDIFFDKKNDNQTLARSAPPNHLKRTLGVFHLCLLICLESAR